MGRISKYEEHGLNTVAKIAEKGDVHERWLFNLSLAGASTNRSGSLGRFAEFPGSVVNRHAMARTHTISSQQTSPIALAKSTATCPKAKMYRTSLMRIGIWFA
jgi:hypothetical protein